MYVLFLVIGALISGIVLYFLFQSRLHNIAIKNTEIEKENEFLAKLNEDLMQTKDNLQIKLLNYQSSINQLEKTISFLQEESQNLSLEINTKQQQLNDIDIKSSLCTNELIQKANELAELQARKEEVEKAILLSAQMAEEAGKELYEKSIALAQERLEGSATMLAEEYNKHQEECIQNYLDLQKEMSEQFAAAEALLRQQLSSLEAEVADIREKRDAAINALMREEERKLETDKYRIILNEEDSVEITRIRDLAPSFRNPRPLYKALWESYFRNPTNDLVLRTVGSGRQVGIYKITSLLNGMTYIGQSADIGERFKEHIKAGLGLESSTNILYSAMKRQGVENFTFEVLENCKREQLNAREAYWIEFYQSQKFGFNMTRGNKK